MQIVRAIHWFNPLVWWAAWKIQVERERACDDLVINSGIEATDYAEHLLRIACSFRTRAVVDLAGLAIGTPIGWKDGCWHDLSHHDESSGSYP